MSWVLGASHGPYAHALHKEAFWLFFGACAQPAIFIGINWDEQHQFLIIDPPVC